MCPVRPRTPALASRPLLRSASLAAALVGAAACSAERYERRSDARAQRILEAGLEDTLGNRPATVVYPRSRPDAPSGPEPEAVPGGEPFEPVGEAAAVAPPPELPPRRLLTLREALELAFRHGRSYKTQRETLYLQALSLANTRHTFSPQLASTLSYVFADTEDLPSSRSAGFAASLDQVLPWSGRLSAGIDAGHADLAGSDGEFRVGASVQLVQPLLRGAGRSVSHEPLVQAERDMVYAIRAFDLFREDYSIGVASDFYGLVSQKQSIENLRKNLQGFVFGRRQAEALFEVGRTTELDVLRARRSELGSQDSLIAAEENYELALDRFRISLGLPPEERIDVEPTAPAFVPVAFDLAEAIDVALRNRLDLLTRRQQLEDVERDVRLARNGLLPDLDLTLRYDRLGAVGASLFHQRSGDGAVSAGITLGLPVDRFSEANAYQSALVGQRQAMRSFEEFRDNLVVEIQSAFRELERRRQSLEIQRQLIVDQEKNVRIAQIRFEQGDFSNRDVVEANEALLDARNALIDEQVNYEISRLQLLRDLGILFIDERGMWTE